VRVVVATSLGGAGHLEPVAAVGRQLASFGHDVTLLVPPALVPAARTAGLALVVGGEPAPAVVHAYRDRLGRGAAAADPGLIDRELFAEHGTRAMLPAAVALAERLRPDLVLREPCEYASAVAARSGGLPLGTIAISQARIERDVLSMVGAVVDGFGAGTADAIARAPFLTAFPAGLDPSPWDVTVRYRVAPATPAPLPRWWDDAAAPLVYVTFGSIVSHTELAARAFRTAATALGDAKVRVLLTVGRGFDRAALGALPGNVHVEPWVPQASVLAACDVVVCHGGSGTTFGALAAGLPVVVCPLFADNARNGAVVAGAGAGLVVAAGTGEDAWADVGPALRAAVERVLDDPSYGDAARRVGDEMAAYPLADEAVAACDWVP
jgi:UDP:flavonoid glycosyltransferase YjiC (YdhE family)